MNKLVNRIIDRLVYENIIKEEDREIYVFGLSYMLLTAFNIFTIVFIGYISGKFFESIIFVSCIIMIRSYSGGYHSDSALICYFISIVFIGVALAYINIIAVDANISLIIIMLSIVLIILLSPVGNKNKPLDLIEKRIYKKKVIKIVGILLIIGIVFKSYEYYEYLQIESCAFLISATMLIIGAKIKDLSLKVIYK